MQSEPVMMLPLTLTEFRAQIREAIAEELEQAASNRKPTEQAKYMTAEQAAEFLKIGITTLRTSTTKGLFTGYRVGSRVLYKQSELEAALKRTDQYSIGGKKRGPKPKNQANA
ncbi:helix-turn-helix domain-containing protein [Hymenobacter lapidiphilus]|uniref:helix-turn-helix domain-containing protein n=1 Tax=Hymenobacter sp. CCM 8763 TaxID=2303334 RepID=UPI0011C0E69A|nr:helix-turn-helix domain-containing protein [Hymenobacter sp. CCM 8763]